MPKKYLSYTKNNHEDFMKMIDENMKLRSYLRAYIPDFNIPLDDSNQILESFEKIADKIIPILSSLEIIPNGIKVNTPSKSLKLQKFKAKDKDLRSDVVIGQASEIFEAVEGKAILVSSNSVRKKLKSLGLDPRLINSSSGPIFVDDYKKLGHNLPEKALNGIQKKIDNLISELKQIVDNRQEIIFIYAPDDITDNINIKRISELEEILGTKLELIQVQSWDLF